MSALSIALLLSLGVVLAQAREIRRLRRAIIAAQFATRSRRAAAEPPLDFGMGMQPPGTCQECWVTKQEAVPALGDQIPPELQGVSIGALPQRTCAACLLYAADMLRQRYGEAALRGGERRDSIGGKLPNVSATLRQALLDRRRGYPWAD